MISRHWDEKEYNWVDAYIYTDTKVKHIQPFFEHNVRHNWFDRKPYLGIRSPSKSFFGGYFSSESHKKSEESKLREKIKARVRRLRTDLSDDQLDSDIDDIIRLENEMMDLSLKGRNKFGYYEDSCITLAKMRAEYPNVPWLKILKTVFKTVDIDIDENQQVATYNPFYLKKIGELLTNQTKRTLANYIGWKIIYKFGAKAIYEFQKQDVDEFDDDDTLKKLCYATTEKVFHDAIKFLYMKKYLTDEGIDDLYGFLSQLKTSLNYSLQQADWMDNETRSKAQFKLEKMVGNLGLPDNIYTIEELDKAFEPTGWISSENYVNAYRKMMEFHGKNKLRLLRQKSERRSLTTVNAFYAPYANRMALMIGILQPPMYYHKAPLAANFGGIASIIGHEITHGFDDSGSQYDFKGERNNWWDEDTLRIYKEKIQCFIDQYSNVTEPVTGKRLNGKMTVGDNVADNGGLRLAFDAYKEYARTKHPEKNFKLPFEMSDFTTEQLFFISVANLYCHNYYNETISALLSYDSHSPNSVRVNVPMQNSENFAKAFNCKPGSPMNPENKCVLW
ncbi:neprilysin-like protein [Dinothrombium tinctorium]|uniref:Neprilysin-like protein n=1 Tax=Dinothrombium tinctorium TaxID=1965070 RepID=A0A3S3P8R0_9ACAR|nr:neprilysin-like protein [Dinothrombium tinctorium]